MKKNIEQNMNKSLLPAAVVIASLALSPHVGSLEALNNKSDEDHSQGQSVKTPAQSQSVSEVDASAHLSSSVKAAPVKGQELQTVELTDTNAKPKEENLDGEKGIVRSDAEGAPAVSTSNLAFESVQEDVIPFVATGVSWKKGEEVIQVSIQVKENGTWSEWNHMAINAAPDSESDTIGSDPLLTDGADGVHVQVFTKSGKAPENLKVSMINPGVSATDGSIAEEVKETAPVVATKASAILDSSGNKVESEPVRATLTASTADAIKPAIISRAQWGADESLVSPSSQSSKLSAIYLHHTAGSNNYTSSGAVQQVRSVFMYHTAVLDWGDIGYHFLVDKFGNIYEGRRGAIDSLPIGAQSGGFNTNTIGISAIGNYDEVAPSSAMINSIQKVAAWKSAKHGLNINSTTTLTSGGNQKYKAGTKVTVPTFVPHQATSYTNCPGQYLLSKMPAMRINSATLASKATSSPTVIPSTPAPTSPAPTTTTAKTYTVKSGDGWWLISYKTGVSASTIQKLNNMTSSTVLHPGMVLKLTSTSTTTSPAPAPAPSTSTTGTYKVQSGDGWWLISSKTGTPLSTLLSLNKATTSTPLYPGMILKTSSTSSTTYSTATTTKTYTVKSGDGWWLISYKTGVSASTIQKLNNMTSSTVLHPGMVLKLN